MYLVDTNVISAGAAALTNQPLVDWMDRNSERLYLSTVTIAEIQDGIAKLRREGATRKAASLTQWFETLLHLYAPRVLAFDVATARIAGALSDVARAKGHAPGFADLSIAATARAHGLILLTRNVKHFAPYGVTSHDPFASLPK